MRRWRVMGCRVLGVAKAAFRTGALPGDQHDFQV